MDMRARGGCPKHRSCHIATFGTGKSWSLLCVAGPSDGWRIALGGEGSKMLISQGLEVTEYKVLMHAQLINTKHLFRALQAPQEERGAAQVLGPDKNAPPAAESGSPLQAHPHFIGFLNQQKSHKEDPNRRSAPPRRPSVISTLFPWGGVPKAVAPPLPKAAPH